jgi:uncharacterized membrane protein SpoIIM required for sporulation
MELAKFLQRRRPDWMRLEEILRHVEGSGLASLNDEQAVEFGQLYRRAASDLNQAQTFVSGEATERYLNDLVARAYLAIYGKSRFRPTELLRFLFWGYPAVFRRYLPHFALAAALFAAGTAFGYLASKYDKDTARAYLLPPQSIQPEEKGADDSMEYNTDRVAAFSAFLFTHNVGVTLLAFALGITFGLGTAWMMFYNGVTTGALAAVFVEAGQLTAFATGILPHGVLEIPAMLLGGAAGFVLAQGFLRVRPWPRREEMGQTGKQAVLLLFGCVPLLSAAACLEAGVARAPDWFLDKGVKLAVAGVIGLLFLMYIFLLGWKSPAGQRSKS